MGRIRFPDFFAFVPDAEGTCRDPDAGRDTCGVVAVEAAGSRVGGANGDPDGRAGEAGLGATEWTGGKPTGKAAGDTIGVFAKETADEAGRGDETCIETPSGFVNVIAGACAGLSSEFAVVMRGCTPTEGTPI